MIHYSLSIWHTGELLEFLFSEGEFACARPGSDSPDEANCGAQSNCGSSSPQTQQYLLESACPHCDPPGPDQILQVPETKIRSTEAQQWGKLQSPPAR